MRQLAIIKIFFKDGNIGYFKDEETITADRKQAARFSITYASGLCRGLNWCIKLYEDQKTLKAEMEVIAL